jgi:transposase
MESATSIEAVLACGEQSVEVRHLAIRPDMIVIQLGRHGESARCPSCGSASHRVQSRYMRTIADLPWRGTPVILRWEVRRFFCDDNQCAQMIFAERLEPLAPRRGRTTRRLDDALATIGVECGGEPGCRLSAELGIHTSGDTILRRVRTLPLEQKLTPRVIGIDDFALRKGHRYGTVIVDHESHRVVDLLPDRSSESTAHWLEAQPQVELVTRDRSTLYAKGISTSNPDAIQVADRFHLHANLREALVRLLDRHHAQISAAAKVAAENAKTSEESTPTGEEAIQADVAQAEYATALIINEPGPATLSKAARLSLERRERRLEKYQKVIALQDRGLSLRAIAQQLGMGRDSVTKFLRAGSFPERARTRRPRGINPVADQLRRLWDSGIHNATELHHKLRATGFTGSYEMVRRQVAPWRDAVTQSRTPGRNPRPRPIGSKPLRISSDRLSWLLLQNELQREPGEEELIQQLLGACEPVRTACDLVLQFKQIMPAGQSEPLRQWIGRARGAEIAMEIRSFAEGLERDWPSVKAAVELPWSNGRAEGHVNRIKLIKRKMYGRANFDLLRIRVMARGP